MNLSSYFELFSYKTFINIAVNLVFYIKQELVKDIVSFMTCIY